MDVIDRSRVWKNLKQRLALRRMGCCGATSSPTAPTIIEEDSDMNLAMALAAERNFRLSNVGTSGMRQVKTLVALIEETDGVDLKKVRKRGRRTAALNTGEGYDGACCVCMERNKGAAFIPCGHTFCRACWRELWLNRGSCPVCNRSITEILDIF